jgi:hypothetical protein
MPHTIYGCHGNQKINIFFLFLQKLVAMWFCDESVDYTNNVFGLKVMQNCCDTSYEQNEPLNWYLL